MSKSAGNTFLVRKLLDEYSADELRYYLLKSHYREDMEFSLSCLKSAGKEHAKLVETAAGRLAGLSREASKKDQPSQSELDKMLAPFYSAMDDDLDTPKALKWVRDEMIGRMGEKSRSDGNLNHHALRVVSDLLGVDFLAGF
jgi:cysteinyl-tRNA synthetase